MKLTNRSEYALLALIYLARQEPGQLISGEEIARTQEIPKQFLRQILYALKQGRLIRSEKGKDGGYALARLPTQISLAEVIRLFEGAIAPSRSASKHFYQPTPIEKEKRLLALFKELRTLMARRLEQTTLGDMI